MSGESIAYDLNPVIDVLDDGDVHVLVEVGHKLLHGIQQVGCLSVRVLIS